MMNKERAKVFPDYHMRFVLEKNFNLKIFKVVEVEPFEHRNRV